MKKLIAILFILFSFATFSALNKAPAFSGIDQYNVEQSLDNYKGKFIILTFWATWCPACKFELPNLEKLYKQYGSNKNDIVFLGVNNENMESAKKLLTTTNTTFPTIISHDAFEKYPIRAFPTIVIIDRNGNINNYTVGAIPKETLEKYINSELLQKSF